MKKIVLFLGLIFCFSALLPIIEAEAQHRRPDLSGRDGQFSVNRDPYNAGGNPASGDSGGSGASGGGIFGGVFGFDDLIDDGNGMYGDSGITEVDCDSIRAVEVGRPAVLGALFGGDAQEEFLATAECRSITAYHYLRRISYIYFGFGVIALTFMAYFGQFTYKWFFAFCGGLFILAAGQAMIELLN
ncbi:MAG: hypothetical protein ACTSXQ_01640 [Alphaproteobacteria bacterium]